MEDKPKFPFGVAIWSGLSTTAVAFVVAFSLGWIMTSGSAEQMKEEAVQTSRVELLTPVCVAQAIADPLFAERSALLVEARSFDRDDMIEEYAWAVAPGSETADDDVVDDCADFIVDQAEAVVAEAST